MASNVFFFKITAIRHLGFLKTEICNSVHMVQRVNVHHYAKVGAD